MAQVNPKLMELAPYGVFFLLARIFSSQGLDAFGGMVWYFCTVLVVLFVHDFRYQRHDVVDNSPDLNVHVVTPRRPSELGPSRLLGEDDHTLN